MDPVRQQIPNPDSAFYDLSIDPRLLTGYFISFLQYMFADYRNLENPAFRKNSITWAPDDLENENLTKKILIVPAVDFNPRDAMHRPALIVSRNDFNVGMKLAMGNKFHTPASLLGQQDPNYVATLGQNQQLVLIEGSHTILVIFKTGAASEALAIDVWHTFIDYQMVIRKDLGLSEMNIGPLQKTGRLEEYEEMWVTPIVVGYRYQRATIVRQESPILKAFSLAHSGADETLQQI